MISFCVHAHAHLQDNKALYFMHAIYNILLCAAPKPPANVKATATTSTSILVTWTGPTNTKYFVTFYPTNVGISETVSELVSSTRAELINLKKFTTYTIFVQTLTFMLSEPSNVVMETTLEDGMHMCCVHLCVHAYKC